MIHVIEMHLLQRFGLGGLLHRLTKQCGKVTKMTTLSYRFYYKVSKRLRHYTSLHPRSIQRSVNINSTNTIINELKFKIC